MFTPACQSPPPPPSEILRISCPAYPSTLDPRKSGDYTSATIICLLYEGLTRCLADGTPQPAIAESIDISKDKKTYLFHLRKSHWSDGTPLTAFDFEKSWKQALDPSSPSPSAYLFYPILHAEAACQKVKTIDEVGIRALDELTLEVQLERPASHFVSLTSFPSFFPVPQHRLENVDSSASPTQCVVNGPFVVDAVHFRASLGLRKNPFFWNHSSIRLGGISILILPNPTTALEMFERGELDWLGGHLSPIPPDAITSLLDKLQFSPMAASSFCAFNVARAPFSNEHLRKALSLAIDKDEIAEAILTAQQLPATRCIPPSLDHGNNRNLCASFNAAEARRHFEEGIRELGAEISSITLYYSTGTIDGRIAQVLQQKWEEILGLHIVLKQNDFKTHKELLHRRDYDVAITNWIAQYQDPINILERFKSRHNAKNYPAWEDPEFVTLLNCAQETPDPQERAALIDRAEEILAESAAIAPLYHWSNPSLSHPRVKNMQTTPTGGTLFESCWLGEPQK